MIELENIPHIGEISNHGLYHGARQKNTCLLYTSDAADEL